MLLLLLSLGFMPFIYFGIETHMNKLVKVTKIDGLSDYIFILLMIIAISGIIISFINKITF